MKFLLTRPLADSQTLAHTLRAAGHQVTVRPMLEIVDRGEPVELDGVQALLLTSANGVRALSKATERRDLTAFAVGAATAAALREAGFSDVRAADGDVAGLAALVRRDCAPDGGDLLHVAGSALAGDLAGDLAAAGFAVRRAVLYDAVPADSLDAELFDQGFDVVLFFSPRTAAAFARLAQGGGFSARCAQSEAWCLSAAVAEAASALPWRAVRVASQPDQTHLLALQELFTPMSETPSPAAPSPASAPPAPAASIQAANIQAATAAGRAAGRWLGRLIFLLLVIALAGFVWVRFGGQVWPGKALERRLAALENSVTALGGRQDQAEDAVAELRRQAEDASRQLADLAASQTQAAATGGPTNAQLDSKAAALAAQIQAQEARLAGLEQVLASGRAGLPATLALARLRDRVETGQPFADALKQFAALAAQMGPAGRAMQGDVAGLQTISDGVATHAQLRDGLTSAASAAEDALRTAPGAGWLQRIAADFRHLIVIRRVDDEAPDAPAAIFDRAADALDQDDLAAAFAEIAKLRGRAAEAAASWRGQAEARLAAEDGLARLETALSAALAAPVPAIPAQTGAGRP